MKLTLMMLALVAVSANLEAKSVGCVAQHETMLWDYNALNDKKADYSVKYTVDNLEKEIVFAFCRDVLSDCKGKSSLAQLWWTNEGEQDCARLTKQQSVLTEPKVAFKNTTQGGEHIEMTFQSDDVCINADVENEVPAVNYSVTYDIECNPDNKDPVMEFVQSSIADNECNPKIRISSKHGCAIIDVNGLWRWVEKNWWVASIAFIAIGAFQLVLGQKLIKPTIFILTTCAVLGGVLVFFYAIVLPTSTVTWLVWLLGGIGLVLGLIAGFFMTKLMRIGVGLLGGWVGVVSALLIHEAFMHAVHQRWIFWIMLVGMGLIFAVIAFWQYKKVQILGTCMIGSYLFIRGFSLFIGGYPNEFTLIDDI